MELKLRTLRLNLYNQENIIPGRALNHFRVAQAQLKYLKQLENPQQLTDEAFLQVLNTFYEVLGVDDKTSGPEVISAAKSILSSERLAEDILSYVEMLKAMGSQIKGLISDQQQQLKQKLSVLSGMDTSIDTALASLNKGSSLGGR